MGYRSDVAIKCQERAFDMLMKAAKENDFRPDFSGANRDETEFAVCWYDVKWYTDFPEVQAIERVLRRLNEFGDDGDYGYQFVRIGENYDDVETRENTYDLDLYVNRSIGGLEDMDENYNDERYLDYPKNEAPVEFNEDDFDIYGFMF